MATKPFTVDGNIVVDEATLSNSTTSLVLPAGSTITGGGAVLDATNSDTDDLTEGVTNLYFTDARADARIALQAGANLDLSGKSTTDLSEGTNLYYTQGRFDTAFTAKSTTDLSEGTNLYYTQGRFDTAFTAKSTTDLAEGTNLYYTDTRADARIALQAGANLDLSSKSTTDLAEGTNLYYTDTRADARIAAASITDLSDADQSVQTTDNVTFANITATGYIAGPATFTIDPAAVGDATGTVVILGDLQVDGTTTTINSTTLDVDDLNITVASGAANAAAANGAGLTVDGASATLTYDSANDRWAMNKSLDVTGTITADGLTVDGTAVEVVSINSTQNGAQISFDSASTTNDWSIGISNSADGDFLIYQNAAAGAGDLRLYTNGQERLTILSGGDVGIDTDTLYVDATNNRVGVGTTVPATALDVTGTVTADGLNVSGTNDVALIITNQSNYTEGLTIRNTANWGYGSSVSFESKTSDGGSNAEVGRIQSTWNAAGYHGLDFYALNNNTLLRHMRLDGSGDFSLYDDTGVNAKFFWDASAESLGIGTDSPVELLHANGSIRLTTDVSTTRRLYALSGTGTYALNSSGGAAIAFHRDATNNDEIAFETHWQGNQHAERMRIDNQGNVGIGTSTPDTILEIVSSNPILTLRDTSTGFNNGDATLRLAESGAGDTLGGYFDVRLDASMLKFDFTPEGGSVSTYMAINSSDGNVGIGTDNPNSVTNYKTLHIDGTVGSLIDMGASNLESRIVADTNGLGFQVTPGSHTHQNIRWKAGQISGAVDSHMILLANGNVGIGDNAPAGKLEVENTSVNYAILGTSNKGHYFESQSDDNTDGFEIYQQHGSNTTRNSFIVNDNRTGSKSAALVVRGDGNVGIGTSSPATPLDVTTAGGGNFVATFQNTTSATPYGLWVKEPASAANGYPSLQVTDNAGTTIRFRVDSGTGNVGIGTSSPGRLLTLFNNDQPVFQITNNTSGLASTNGMIFYQASGSTTHNIDNQGSGSGGDIQFMAAGANTLKIQANGNVGIGNNNPLSSLAVYSSSASAYSNTVDSTTNMSGIRVTASPNESVMTGIWFGTGGDQTGSHWTGIAGSRTNHTVDWGTRLSFYTHPTATTSASSTYERMTIDPAGSVGIGTTSPSHQFHVNGQARVKSLTTDVIKQWTPTGNYSNGTAYVFSTRSEIAALGYGDGMYRFVIFSNTFNAGLSHYSIFVAYDPFYFTDTGSNAPQSFTFGWNTAMGHAPNTGTRAADLVIRHKYAADATYPANQTFEFIPTAGLSNLNSAGGYEFYIRLYKVG